MRKKYGYKVSSLDNPLVLRIALEEVWAALRIIYILAALAAVEAISRALGAWDYYVRGERHMVWDMAWTTKRVTPQEGDRMERERTNAFEVDGPKDGSERTRPFER